MPERDIESLGVMGWGLVAAENSSAVVVAAAAAAAAVTGGADPRFLGFCIKNIEYGSRYR